MLIWHLSCKAQIIFWQLFHEAQMLLWHIFTKFKYYLTFVKSLTHGKYKLLISQKNITFTKFYGNYVYYFHNQVTIKPMNIIHGKTNHLVGLTKPKQAYQQSPAGSD